MKSEKTVITIEATIHANIEKVWKFWTEPEHIMQWNNASDDWHTTKAENDLRVGGKFLSRMEAKDGSFGFDFGGIYTGIKPHELIAYTLGDNRKVEVIFSKSGNDTLITSHFELETQNPIEMQKGGWQAILNNFKKHVEK
ncbi:MAG: SRPBCC family protein [Bacteroidota bacterium]